jgi:hypothetical protein
MMATGVARTLFASALFVSAALTGLLSAAGCAPSPAASKAPAPLNIGFVLYTKGDTPGTLKARWRYTTEFSGTGVATGGPAEGFVGRYHVRYFDENGTFSDEYDLVIERNGDFYNGSWLTSGKVSASGVGMKVADGVAMGWRRIID